MGNSLFCIKSGLVFVWFLLLCAPSGVRAEGRNLSWLDESLTEFKNHPKEFAMRKIQKYDPMTLKPVRISSKFTAAQRASRDFVVLKSMQHHGSGNQILGRIEDNDRPEDLVDVVKLRTLQDIETAKLTSATLPTLLGLMIIGPLIRV